MRPTKIQTVFFLATLLIFVLAFFLIFGGGNPFVTPKVVKVSPSPEEKQVSLLPEIEVTFDQKINTKDVSLTSIPQSAFVPTSVKNQPNLLLFKTQQKLEKETHYFFTLKIKQEEYAWEYTTTATEIGAVPGWSENFQKSQEEYQQEYPPAEVSVLNALMAQIPYYSQNYWLEFFAKDNTLIGHLCQKPFDQSRQEAEKWLNEQGFNQLHKLKPQLKWLEGCEPPKTIPLISPAL